MAEMGLSARTRGKDGALLERWRAQCGTTRSTIQESLKPRIHRGILAQRRILDPSRAFLSPAASSAFSPHQSYVWRTDESFRPDAVDICCCRDDTRVVSVLPVVLDRDDGEEPRRRELLAVHALRGRVECGARAGGLVPGTPMAVARSRVIRELLDLIAALDRRVPQVERAGEAAIARDAAASRDPPKRDPSKRGSTQLPELF
jgi:hypothetical protein